MSAYVVVKLGGNALAAVTDFETALDALARDLVALRDVGVAPVVVHGAGPQISALLTQLGVPTTFVDGLRVTDERTMDVVAMALSHVNVLLVAGLNRRGVHCAGVAGPDASTITATVRGEAWGRASGSVTVSPGFLESLCANDIVPIVNPVAVDADGQLVNCNADAVAGALAGALGAEALFLLSDVDQLRLDPDDPSSAVATVTRATIDELVASGMVRDGMRPKMDAALAAVDAGARRVVLTNGARSHALIDALEHRGLYTEVTQ